MSNTKYISMINELLQQVQEEAIEQAVDARKSIESHYLNSKQAARYLAVSESTIYTLTKKGLLGYFQPGGKRHIKRFTKQHLEDYMKGENRHGKIE